MTPLASWRHACAALPLALGLALAVPAGAAPATPVAAPALSVPPLKFTERRLANGLQVIAAESHASPTVAVQVWYHVGARDDPPGRSGFAHLFEHLMFKSTRYLKAEQFDRLTEDVGGQNNAFTSDDVTAYHEVVPSNHLQTLLWAEAERMSNLNVDKGNFESERAVVEEEYRQRVLASPYGRLFNGIAPASYRVHPYQRSAIGSIEDLQRATLDDVVAFHANQYRPDNATLVVTGDFEPAQLQAWVDQYFGPLKRPEAPVPRGPNEEPAWPDNRTVQLSGPQVPLPAVALTWLAPTVTSADAPALRVAAALLSGGKSSRLNENLVYRQRLASDAGFEADLRAGPGLLTAYAIAAGGKALPAVRAALLKEVQSLVQRPPSAAEMARVKTGLLTRALQERQTPLGLGMALAGAAVLEGGPAQADRGLQALQAVTAADVQRVMRKYIAGARHTTIEYTQARSPQ
jgi:zinc protease